MPTKGHVVKAMVFPVVMYRCESWPIKKAERWRIDAFELWYWRRLWRVPWTARRSNQSVLKEVSPEYHWKDWYWSWNANTLVTWYEELTRLKRPWCWERLKAEEKGMTEDEMAGWHHQLDGHEFEKTPGDGEGQGCLTCCSPWGRKESDTTEQLNWTELNSSPILYPWSLTGVIPWVLLSGLSKYLLALYSIPSVLSLVQGFLRYCPDHSHGSLAFFLPFWYLLSFCPSDPLWTILHTAAKLSYEYWMNLIVLSLANTSHVFSILTIKFQTL